MKIPLIFLFSVFMVVASLKNYAQVTGSVANPKATLNKTDAAVGKDPAIPITVSGVKSLKLMLKGVEGQIYINNNWTLGTIVLRDGGMIDNYYLRYNLLSDQMQFIAGHDTLTFASPQELNTVTFGGHTFIYENYQCENVIRQGYFDLLVPGKNKLMLKRQVTCQKPDAKNPTNVSTTKYLIDDYYFISKKGMPATKIMCNRESALQVLNEHNEDIDLYLRITGNKVRTIEELKNLVSYYNSLDEDY
jgi:hypothetical protein